MDVGREKVGKAIDARNLGAAGAGRWNKGKLPAEGPNAGSWETQDNTDRNYIYWDRQNGLGYGEYGDRNYNYNPYFDYRSEWPPINRPPIAPCATEISPTNPTQPYRKPPGLDKENAERKKIDDRLKRHGGSQRKSNSKKIRIGQE